MTFEELQELLAEQFSCDTAELDRGVALADLGADHEDMVELAWALGEALGVEIDESDLNVEMTVGELWRYAMDVAENADV
ncbi:MAG TPA: acyl carrier protein [Candidatus Gemmiger avistercoris]|uniref:Acyl carrier protein n=1 Tax=Candidatus Gemmiger avistercoris TaxID=2838606 RepID=A0A9D2FIU7_9FIRM|nr:phosphopantetheine-binding protein [uncultured Subdoligranulum sp.]HIZ62044.1 acyl carrier protein [Candidatus Gemmiger avistercoris]